MILLLVAGIVVVLAGLVAIAFGIPVKEFGFGNTLILTGTIGVCTGLLMLSLAAVLRELRALAGGGATSHDDAGFEPADAVAPKREFEFPLPTGRGDDAEAEPVERPLFSRDQPAADRAATEGSAPPWQDEAARERARGSAPADPDGPEEPEVKPRRNLLFSSSRREREAARAIEAAPLDLDAVPPAGQDAAAPARPSFADSWPPVERDVRPELPRRTARAPSTFNETPGPDLPAPRHVEPEPVPEPAPVTVLKSGVVDGMAYSLYSDGSIEAQMPEGMMRFASIDELREHLDQRG
jgi:hypothetical protein